MATYTFDKIEYGGNTYVVSDSGALQLTGGQVTGPVTFGDSVSIDEATLGDLVVNGSASFTNNLQANTINGVTVGSNPAFTDTKAWASITGKPTATGSKVTGITASTTATKTTLGTAFTIPNVTAAGSASTWAFEEVSIPNVTAAGSASTWAFTGVTVANSISGAVDSSDSTQLNITLGTTTVQSKSSGGNGTAPTLGTAIKVQSKKSGANGTAPTLGTAFTVPNVTGNTSATVSITDNGHTHSIS